MAYNQQQGGYGQYSSYGQGGNPYGQQQQSNPYEQPYGHTGNYSERPELEHHSSSRYDEESAQGSNYEMTNMPNGDPNRILNEVRLIDGELKALDGYHQRLDGLERQYLNSTDMRSDSQLRGAVNTTTTDILTTYKALTHRFGRILSDPESQKPRNKAQVNKLDRNLKEAVQKFQQAQQQFKAKCREQFKRQYLIARPEASQAEVDEAMASGDQQVFSQVLLTSDRRGNAQEVAAAVNSRHKAIQMIEKQMIEIAELYNELNALVVQQEPAVMQIEEKGEQATRHVAQANTELDGAVTKAKSARRKKWMCLGIALLIIIIIVVVVVVVVEVTK